MKLILAAAAWSAAVQAPGLTDLAWLAGSWESRNAERWTEEWWTPPRGGLMIGGGRSGRDDKASSFEHMRIVAEPAGLAFYGMPGGAPAVRFALVRGSGSEAVFENATHDFPQRIHYRLESGKLTATVSLIDGSRAQSWTFSRR
jgi:hypothetical protein